MSILCVHVGKKGHKGRERTLNFWSHTGSWLTAVADSCQYLQRRLQQIFDWLVVYVHLFILLTILDLHLESVPSLLSVKYFTCPAFLNSHCHCFLNRVLLCWASSVSLPCMTAEVPFRFYFDKEITDWTDPRRERGMGGFSTYEAWVGIFWAQYSGIWVCTLEHPARFCVHGI